MKIFYRILFVVCAVVLFRGMMACGGSATGTSGGDASTDTSALTIAERISVVDAQDEASPSVSALTRGLRTIQRAAADLPADSDYNTDAGFTYVEERSMEIFDTINEILCMMNQTAYDEMINLGAYQVMVDKTQCSSDQDSAGQANQSSQNQSSGTNVSEYEYWTVLSERAAGEPHTLSVWVHQSGDGESSAAEREGSREAGGEPAMDILVSVEITEAASDTNPWGIFQMYFLGQAPDGVTPLMRGMLGTQLDDNGNVLLQFADSNGLDGFLFSETATLQKSIDESAGAGSVFQSESSPYGDFEKSFNLAYNESYFLRAKEAGDEKCLSRTEFESTVWRYNLYDTLGARVEVDSGFPIRYEDYFGWAGYHGLWLPTESGIANGDTVYKQTFTQNGPPTEDPYTLFLAGGKLMRHDKKMLTLAEISGIPFSRYTCKESGCGEFRIEWSSLDEKFYITGQMNQQTWIIENIDPPVEFAPNDFDWSLNLWSQSLGGDGQINLFDQAGQRVALTNETPMIFHTQTTVLPTDVSIPSNLICFENCLTPTLEYFTGTGMEDWEISLSNLAMETPYTEMEAGTNYVQYVFDSELMLLKMGQGQFISYAAGVNNDNITGLGGAWTGALIEADQLSALACEWNPEGATCPWRAYQELDSYYTWETGPNDWNRLALLQDATGGFVAFEPPFMVEYAHTTGTKYMLEYQGLGNIFGIPGMCVDMDTGLETDCAFNADEEKMIRWVNQFSIADGSVVTNLNDDTEYYVKGLDKEQRMIAVDVAECTAAGLSLTSYTLPDLSSFVAPDIGVEPVDAPIMVIGGVVQ